MIKKLPHCLTKHGLRLVTEDISPNYVLIPLPTKGANKKK